MLPAALDFAPSVCLDNALLREDIARGEAVPIDEILSLAAAAQAIYLTATIESRELDGITQCHKLWADVAKLFDELCAPWTDVKTDEEQIQWLLARLRRYRDLALDRVSIYEVTTSQRVAHSRTRADINFEMSHRQRHNLEARGEHEPCSPPHIYQIGHF
jgi:hypothetical protein